jgi:hypothetical protein
LIEATKSIHALSDDFDQTSPMNMKTNLKRSREIYYQHIAQALHTLLDRFTTHIPTNSDAHNTKNQAVQSLLTKALTFLRVFLKIDPKMIISYWTLFLSDSPHIEQEITTLYNQLIAASTSPTPSLATHTTPNESVIIQSYHSLAFKSPLLRLIAQTQKIMLKIQAIQTIHDMLLYSSFQKWLKSCFTSPALVISLDYTTTMTDENLRNTSKYSNRSASQHSMGDKVITQLLSNHIVVYRGSLDATLIGVIISSDSRSSESLIPFRS